MNKQTCPSCGKENREIARYCKSCGSALKPEENADRILGGLVGLDHIRNDISGIVRVISRMKREGPLIRMNYSMILSGNSGTAKSLIGDLFYDSLKELGVVTMEKPVFIDSGEFIGYDNEAVCRLFKKAEGGMIILDNVQSLIINGEAVAPLKRMLVEMDEHPNDPIVLLAGLPYGLREFLTDKSNSNFTGRFRKIFFIDNYDSNTLYRIIKSSLGSRYHFSVSEAASERLLKRCRWLVREAKKSDSKLGAENGYLAMREADAIIHGYYNRGGTGRRIEAEDIKGDIHEELPADKVLAKLDSFIGMKSIKKDIRVLYNRMSASSKGGRKPDLHAILTGNPGTGKTTVVRILGEIYNAIGVLDIGHVVEADRSRLVAGYLGQTAIQVNRMVDSALGGILFVDEAYALKHGENDPFGQEAIDTLVKRVEDDRDKFCCILAGYKSDIDDLLTANQGLMSRFSRRFHLEDYNADELYRIFLINLRENDYTMTAEAEKSVKAFFNNRIARKTRDFGNGREARSLFERARNLQASRISSLQEPPAEKDLTILTEDDIPSNREEGSVSLEEAMSRLNTLTGLASVKNKISELTNQLEYNRIRGIENPLSEHFVFTGNPGTGKTTVARIFADILFAIGMLPTRSLIEADRSFLVATHTGETAQKVNRLVDKAMGGVLFIDEAYSLYQGDNDTFGKEAVATLLKRLEDDLGKFVCIAAGYSREMADFISSNSGLESRFTTILEFEDYSARELSLIFLSMCANEGFILSKEANAAVYRMFNNLVARKTRNFGNAREARKLFNKTKSRLSGRIIRLKQDGMKPSSLKDVIARIEKEDIPFAEEGEVD